MRLSLHCRAKNFSCSTAHNVSKANFENSSYGFPQYAPLNATLLQLAYDNKTGPNVAFPAEYDSGCASASALPDTLVGTGTL
jgi:hypothetical protein